MTSIQDLFLHWAGEPCEKCTPLAVNGSNRQYFRLEGSTHSCIAARNPDIRENRAFFYYSRFFFEAGCPVPELYSVSENEDCYLQQDLGDHTLYALLQDKKEELGNPFDEELIGLYKKVLSDLAKIQVSGRNADFSYSYPRNSFDRQSMQWDLNYFKYYFLKTSSVAFDEQLLEDDFQRLMDRLLQVDCEYFLYRDFQARNIMLHEGKPYYIDYQGGRRGAAQYDVASLLYSAKSDLPEELREELLSCYIAELGKLVEVDEHEFRNDYYAYVLIRMLQTLGAYGFRGKIERKEYFLQSIPLALSNLSRLLAEHPQSSIPYLNDVLLQLTKEEK